MKKVYLGDGVYADFDGFHVVLTTESGNGPTNTIKLEASAIDALEIYCDALERQVRESEARPATT